MPIEGLVASSVVDDRLASTSPHGRWSAKRKKKVTLTLLKAMSMSTLSGSLMFASMLINRRWMVVDNEMFCGA
jgi:hypothetical protein